jgi:dipeptidyl-peptidase-4
MRLFVLLLFFPFLAVAQKKQITLEDIYKKGTFRSDPVARFAAANTDSILNSYHVKDDKGRMLDTRDHLLSPDHTKVMYFSGREYIYRRSTKANTYLFDVATGHTIRIDTGKLMHATFSPDGSRIAYVKSNNLYLYDISSNTTKAITTDGKWNYIINGNCDWVYEEEFGFTRAYDWSQKGNYIA